MPRRRKTLNDKSLAFRMPRCRQTLNDETMILFLDNNQLLTKLCSYLERNMANNDEAGGSGVKAFWMLSQEMEEQPHLYEDATFPTDPETTNRGRPRFLASRPATRRTRWRGHWCLRRRHGSLMHPGVRRSAPLQQAAPPSTARPLLAVPRH